MELTDVQGLISTVGFPIFVAVYMLFKGSKDSAELKAAVAELTTAIKVMSKQND